MLFAILCRTASLPVRTVEYLRRCRMHALWWWYKPHNSGRGKRRGVEDVVRRVQMQVLRALVVAKWGSLLAVKLVVARDLGGERGTVTIELSGAEVALSSSGMGCRELQSGQS
jgi:hypothetical protein